jgi:hypothetical protein
MSPFIYPAGDAPRFIMGNAVSLSMVGLATAIYGFLWFWYDRENKKRAEAETVKPEHQGLTSDELAELGDESPHFVYTI